MAISQRVQKQLVHVVVAPAATNLSDAALLQRKVYLDRPRSSRQKRSVLLTAASPLSTAHPAKDATSVSDDKCNTAWTPAEHERFLQALQLFPAGPWKQIAAVVGTKTARQSMTHAQKCRQKVARHERGLKIQSRRFLTSASASESSPRAVPSITPAASQRSNDQQLHARSELNPPSVLSPLGPMTWLLSPRSSMELAPATPVANVAESHCYQPPSSMQLHDVGSVHVEVAPTVSTCSSVPAAWLTHTDNAQPKFELTALRPHEDDHLSVLFMHQCSDIAFTTSTLA